MIGPPWQVFADAVVVPPEPKRAVKATIAPDLLFDLALYRRAGVDLRYHAALPGLLVGAGLLFTFLGLAIALANAGAIVSAADQAERSASLEGLLNAAAIKFWTSLTGLFCSIGYAIHRKRSIKKTERALDHFCRLLEERFPLATPASFQAEANRTLDAQRKSLDTLANDLAQSIGPALDKALDSRLGEHIGPLREAIEKLAAREAEGVGRTLEAMLERFLEKLQTTSGEQLAAVAKRLEEAAQGLESLRLGLDAAGAKLEAAGAKLESAAETLTAKLKEGSKEAADELIRRMRELSEQVAQSVRQQSQRTEQAFVKLLAKIPDIVELLSKASETARGTLETGGKVAGELMEQRAREAAAALVSAADMLGLPLEQAAGRFERAAERTELGAEHLGNASEELASRFGELEAATRAGAGALQTAAQQAAQQLQGAADRAAQHLRAAAEPYTSAAQSLGASSTALRESATRIIGLEQSLREAIGGLKTIATGLDAGAQQLEHVSKQFEAASARFAGIDASLGRTLQEIATQYLVFAQKTGETVKQVDENLGKAVNALGASISELSEMLDDLQSSRPAVVRRP